MHCSEVSGIDLLIVVEDVQIFPGWSQHFSKLQLTPLIFNWGSNGILKHLDWGTILGGSKTIMTIPTVISAVDTHHSAW